MINCPVCPVFLKICLAVHGFSIKEETLEAIRLVKDYIIQNEGVCNVTVTKELMKSCEASRTRYECYLSNQKKKSEEEEARKRALESLSKEKEKLGNRKKCFITKR